MQYSTLEPFEEEEQAQAQAQGQDQSTESGEQHQYQEQAQAQSSESSSEGEPEDLEEAVAPKKHSTISMNVSKLIVFLMVAVFLTISLMLESGDRSPVQKVMEALRNPQSHLLHLEIFCSMRFDLHYLNQHQLQIFHVWSLHYT